jgi:tetratricopeptide (TPR) repeat protein
MSDIDQTVFICYRRSVSSFIARAIFNDLVHHGYDVFMDVESIDAGTFDTIILNQIAARAHFLIILTPGTVEQFMQPEDWLRRETEHAIDLKRNVIPVLVNDFSFEANAAYFTGKLAELPRYNALPLYHEYFDEAMTRLRQRFLTVPVRGRIRATPSEDQAVVQRKIEEAASQPAPTAVQLTAEELFMNGLERYGKGEYRAAITAFNTCLDLYPDYAPAYVVRGAARGNVGDLRGAIADLEHYLDLRDEQQFVRRVGVVQMIYAFKEEIGDAQ